MAKLHSPGCNGGRRMPTASLIPWSCNEHPQDYTYIFQVLIDWPFNSPSAIRNFSFTINDFPFDWYSLSIQESATGVVQFKHGSQNFSRFAGGPNGPLKIDTNPSPHARVTLYTSNRYALSNVPINTTYLSDPHPFNQITPREYAQGSIVPPQS